MSQSSDGQLRTDWEQRALAKGNSLASVLLQNLPQALNNYLHEWHVDLIQTRFLPHIPHRGKVIDVASGYGRISAVIQSTRPDIQLFGLDFAYPYCQYYAANIHAPAICGSIYDLPFPFGFFDGIVAITALMYVENTQEQAVVKQLVQRLRPGGYAFLLDPGVEFLKLASVFTQSRASTSGKGFSQKSYKQFGQTSTTRVVASGGCPMFSLFIPLLYGVAENQGIVRKLLQTTKMLDSKAEKHHKFTLHRWMLVKRIH